MLGFRRRPGTLGLARNKSTLVACPRVDWHCQPITISESGLHLCSQGFQTAKDGQSKELRDIKRFTLWQSNLRQLNNYVPFGSTNGPLLLAGENRLSMVEIFQPYVWWIPPEAFPRRCLGHIPLLARIFGDQKLVVDTSNFGFPETNTELNFLGRFQLVMGVTRKWMVFMSWNILTIERWMMTGGTPYDELETSMWRSLGEMNIPAKRCCFDPHAIIFPVLPGLCLPRRRELQHCRSAKKHGKQARSLRWTARMRRMIWWFGCD